MDTEKSIGTHTSLWTEPKNRVLPF